MMNLRHPCEARIKARTLMRLHVNANTPYAPTLDKKNQKGGTDTDLAAFPSLSPFLSCEQPVMVSRWWCSNRQRCKTGGRGKGERPYFTVNTYATYST